MVHVGQYLQDLQQESGCGQRILVVFLTGVRVWPYLAHVYLAWGLGNAKSLNVAAMQRGHMWTGQLALLGCFEN